MPACNIGPAWLRGTIAAASLRAFAGVTLQDFRLPADSSPSRWMDMKRSRYALRSDQNHHEQQSLSSRFIIIACNADFHASDAMLSVLLRSAINNVSARNAKDARDKNRGTSPVHTEDCGVSFNRGWQSSCWYHSRRILRQAAFSQVSWVRNSAAYSELRRMGIALFSVSQYKPTCKTRHSERLA